jgi:tetratricopeptide (TPR) repeat protein
MNDRNGKHVERLLFHVDWAIQHGLGPRDLVPMLKKLILLAPDHSDAALFGKQQLAEIVLQTEPFRAVVLLREVLQHSDHERAWALLGLSHTLLGNYRCAVSAYTRALGLTPDNPWYAHNLGHLLDAAIGRPEEALRYLRLAHRRLSSDVEVASSYAHALLRAGRGAQAIRVLSAALQDDERALSILSAWRESDPVGAEGVERVADSRDETGGRKSNSARAQTRRKNRASLL